MNSQSPKKLINVRTVLENVAKSGDFQPESLGSRYSFFDGDAEIQRTGHQEFGGAWMEGSISQSAARRF
jgi:hypothetical protein